MTKQDLLAALENKVSNINSVALIDSTNNLSLYVANVTLIKGDIASRENISFYVKNEGEATEVAYWQNSEPYKTIIPVVSFSKQVEDFINSKIADNTIKGAVIESISESNKTSTAKAYTIGTGGVNEKRYMIREVAGNLEISLIV